jgi:hypothetical protein
MTKPSASVEVAELNKRATRELPPDGRILGRSGMGGVSTERLTESVPPSGAVPGFRGGWLRPAWKKGESGNPEGRGIAGSEYQKVRKLCAERSEQAARRLFELMEDEDGRVALMAVSAVLDRGIGKPRDHSDEDNALARMNLNALDPAEQRLLIDLLRRVMGMPAPQIEASTEANSAKRP